MLSWAVAFLIFALIAGVLGFTGLAGTAVGIAKIKNATAQLNI